MCRLPLLATLTAACYVMMPIDFILCQLHVSHTCVCKIGGSGLCQKQRRACILEEPVRASCSCQVTLKAWSFHAAAHAGGSDGRARGGARASRCGGRWTRPGTPASLLTSDRLRHRHTIAYDDGDVENAPLWAPNQLVRSLVLIPAACTGPQFKVCSLHCH